MPRSRFMLLVFVVLALFCAGCRETILHRLSEQDANDVKLALQERGIAAEKTPDKELWSVEVSTEESSAALSIVHYLRLPHVGEESNVHSSNSLFPDKGEQREERERKLQQDLEATLRQIPNVVTARIHLHFSASDSFVGETEKVTKAAALLIVLDEKFHQQDEARSLLAASLGLSAENVVVVSEVLRDPRLQLRSLFPKGRPGTKDAELIVLLKPFAGWVLFLFGLGSFLLLSFRKGRREKQSLLTPSDREDGTEHSADASTFHFGVL